MALPTYVGSGALAAGSGSVTPAFHASTAVDDIALLVVETENDPISLADAQGFTEIPNSPQFAGTLQTDPANRIAVYWKRITTAGGGTAPTTYDPANHVTAALHTFRGCVTSGDPWDVTAGGNDGGANDTTGTIPGDTTTVADCLVVLICGSSRNANSTTTFSAWTNADLANLTEQFDATNTIGLGGGHGMATGEKASAGAFGDTTVTLATSSYKGAFSIALKPPVGGTTTPQAIAATATLTPAITDLASFFRTLAVGSAMSAAFTRLNTFFRTLAVGSALAAVVTPLSTFLRTLAVSSAHAPAVTGVATFFRTLTVTSVHTAAMALAKLYAQAITAVSTLTATLAQVSVVGKVLAVGSTLVASLARVATFSRALPAVSTHIPAMARAGSFFRALPVTSVFDPVVSRAATFYRALSATSPLDPALVRANLFTVALAVTGSWLAGLATQFIEGEPPPLFFYDDYWYGIRRGR